MNYYKRIFYLVFEIILLSITIFTTNKLWSSFDSNIPLIASSYSNYDNRLELDVENTLSLLTPLDDTSLTEAGTLNLNVTNNEQSKRDFIVYLVITDKTTLNINYIKIKYNNNYYYIKDLESHYNDGSNYYKLFKSTIDKEQTNNYNINLYLSSETPNSEQGKTLDFNIKVEEI